MLGGSVTGPLPLVARDLLKWQGTYLRRWRARILLDDLGTLHRRNAQAYERRSYRACLHYLDERHNCSDRTQREPILTAAAAILTAPSGVHVDTIQLWRAALRTC